MKEKSTSRSENIGYFPSANVANSLSNATFEIADRRNKTIAQRKLLSKMQPSLGEQNQSMPTPNTGELGTIQNKSAVVQRIIGAAHPIAGHDEVLVGAAANRGAAALAIAQYVNLRARQTGPAAHDANSALGANNAGNLYVRKDYTDAGGNASSLEVWLEMTPGGGGYVKRVRINENNALVMDRVMNDPHPSAFNTALAVNAALGAVGAVGNRQYGSVHGVQGGDAAALDIDGTHEHSADNITKVVGEGARFAWIATGLSNGTIGNASRNVFKATVRVPQIGRFTMNPTFEELWGAWNSAFDRHYMRDKNSAIDLLRTRMIAGWTRPEQGAVQGAAPLLSGQEAAGQVTSLVKDGIIKALPRAVPNSNGANIVTDLHMTWHSSD